MTYVFKENTYKINRRGTILSCGRSPENSEQWHIIGENLAEVILYFYGIIINWS